ncbi:helix-turn-helix domain-containing protein [Spartinivicinus poritis]|uniref:helix-turn-helix domain-containing protein n=1 Tax=Spartinivicinus poritis TaxID=2994640 RepID=UPI003CC91E94
MVKAYKQITLEERYQISAYLAAGFSRSAIAVSLNRFFFTPKNDSQVIYIGLG